LSSRRRKENEENSTEKAHDDGAMLDRKKASRLDPSGPIKESGNGILYSLLEF